MIFSKPGATSIKPGVTSIKPDVTVSKPGATFNRQERSLRSQAGSVLSSLAVVLSVSASVWAGLNTVAPQSAQAVVRSAVGEAVSFSCRDTEATIHQKGGPVVAIGGSRIYIGYRQVSANNQNPIMARFDNGRRVWCRENYEITEDDGRGYGLLWNGNNVLYAVFSATGTQGTVSQDYRRFTTNGWLRNYGSGGGPQVSVIARINPSTGAPVAGTFLSGVLSNGQTNSLQVRGLSWTGTRLVVTADSWYSPRRADRSALTCSGSSPFRYRVVFNPYLSRVYGASAYRCS